MLSQADNDILTRVGPGTPMGQLMRQYWLPALYSHELEADGAPLRIRLLGEDLVAYRDSGGRPGVLAEACPHRGASMFFGRNEEDGLRCVYHGWKFDVTGQCVDMPNEPAESNFKHKIRAGAYAARDFGDVVWVYLGPRQAEPPGLPMFEWGLVPEGQRKHERKGVRNCNWMQGLEGDIDTSHLYFLHGRLRAEDPPHWGVYHPDKAPKLEVVDTNYGVVYGARRVEDADHIYWRTTQFLFPCFAMFPAQDDGVVPSHIWVPIDDTHTLYWGLTWHPYQAYERSLFSLGTGMGNLKPSQHGRPFANWWPEPSLTNDFGIDREAQRRQNYTGIPNITLQDAAMTDGMGPILDRTREHLGTSDSTVIRVRRRLVQAAKALRDQGVTPPCVDEPDLYRRRSCSIILHSTQPWEATLAGWHAGLAPMPAAAPVERTFTENFL